MSGLAGGDAIPPITPKTGKNQVRTRSLATRSLRPSPLTSLGRQFYTSTLTFRVRDLADVQRARLGLIERLALADADCAIAGRRGEEAVEVAADTGFEVKDLFHGIIARAAQPEQQRVRRHGPRIPV